MVPVYSVVVYQLNKFAISRYYVETRLFVVVVANAKLDNRIAYIKTIELCVHV